MTAHEHGLASHSLVSSGRQAISLVDCMSFAVMRRLHLQRAFAFDPHFSEQGFEVVP